MGDVFTPLDLIIFFTALVGVMAVGLIAGRKENTSEDYFLAGRSVPWWGVAGSIFGSNVSANHMVGMMGIGFSIGFAQSHFELGAIFGLMVLCYGFLPVYRKLKLFTLSEYLGRRYDERSRLAYAMIMVLIMVVVQMVPGLYIGARSICVLMGGEAMETVAEVQSEGNVAAGSEPTPVTVQARNVNQTYYNVFVIALAVIAAAYTVFGGLKAVIWTDVIQSALLLAAGIGVALLTFQKIGGWEQMIALDQAGAHKMRLYRPMNDPDLPWTGVFTGLMAMHCFYWGTNQFIVQRALGARSDSEARLGIVAAGFLKLLIPFFAIGTGVAAYYLFQSENLNVDPDAAFPELVKLVIPFGSGIVGLIAAGLIGAILSSIDSMMNSAATIVSFDIYKKYINPAATDRNMILVGRVSILVFVTLAASLTIFVLNPNSKENFFLQIVDYSSYLTPGLLVAFIVGMFWRRGTGTGAIATMLAGILFSWAVQFGYDSNLGMHPKVHGVITGRLAIEKVKVDELPQEMRHETLSARRSHLDQFMSEFLIKNSVETIDVEMMDFHQKQTYIKEHEKELMPVIGRFGPKLNFFHRVVIVLSLCVLVHVLVSLGGQPDAQKSRLVWTDLGGHSASDLKNLLRAFLISLAVFALLGWLMYIEWLIPETCAALGAIWTFLLFTGTIVRSLMKRQAAGDGRAELTLPVALVCDDRFWAGILCALAVFMHYYFY